MKILYRSHIEDAGWGPWVTDGKLSGTVGSALRMEAIEIKLEELNGLDIQMEYQAHVAEIGWQGLKTDGQTAGTTGQATRLEALRIRLTGTDSDKYELKYRLHVENIGWQLWKTNGELAGTTGVALRAEAIEIRLVLADPNKTVPDGTIIETDPETGLPKVDPITGIPLGKELTIGYETHTQNIGWSKQVAGGLLSGRVGQNLQMEAIRMIVLNKGTLNLGIEYQAHVMDDGWQSIVNNNATAGTTDQAKQLEALRIRLTGTDASKYSVWYRIHVQNEGWQDWRRDWEIAGTTGQALQAEAIYILIAEKSKNLTRIPTLEPTMSVNYRSHIQNQGWAQWVKNGRKSGTSGMALRMEAFEMNLSALDNINLGVRYQAHCQNIGWQGWKTENQTAGTTGQSLRLEAIRIELTGADAGKYQIQYRVHLEDKGWSDWAINGGIAGTAGESRRLEAISVVITKKALATQSTTNEIKNKVPYYQVFATEFPNREYLLHDLRTENKLIDLVKTEGENKVDGLTFTIDPTHEHYHVLKELKTTILVYAEYSNQRIEKVFEGRIVQEETDYNNIKKVTCEGERGYLRDGIQRPGKHENLTNEQWLTMVLDGYNQSVTADRRFYMGIVTLENGKLDALRENDYINTLDLINGALINELGGYLQIEQIGGFRFLNYLENFGQVSTQAVEFGKNLLDLKKSSQSLDIISALIPTGKTIDDKKLGIADVNNNADYIYNETLVNRYGWIFGHKEWEEIDDAETLKQKGYEYLERIANRGLTLELTALDLSLVNIDIDQIKVGDALRCVSKPHNIDTFLIVNHKTLDLNDPSKDKIVMGDEVGTLTGSGGYSNSGGGGGGFKSYILKSESEEMAEATIKDAEYTENELSENLGELQTNFEYLEGDLEEVITTTQNIANSKNRVFYQTTTPTDSPIKGDLWFQTNNNYLLRVYTGSSWTIQAFGSSQLGDGAVIARNILTGAINADKISANAITNEKFYGNVIESKNYIYNEQGTKLYLNTGVFDTKNFKINSAGDVQVKGDLELGGINAITVKDTIGNTVGDIKYVDNSGLPEGDKALRVYATRQLELSVGAQGEAQSRMAEILVKNRRVFAASNFDGIEVVSLGISDASIVLSNYPGINPKLKASGATDKRTLSSLGLPTGVTTISGRESSVTLNGLGNFVTLNGNIITDLAAVPRRLVTLPVGFRPTSTISTVAFCGIKQITLELKVEPNGEVLLWQTSQVQQDEHIYFNVSWYL